mgnify:CR=1 FL=1
MSKKPLNISESAAVQMPMKTVASLILLVAAGVFAYTELTARLVSLETSRELFENDLLKKSEQVPVDQEQHFLLEDLYKSVEKMEETQEMNMTNKVNIEFLREQLDKALKDIEELAKRQLKSNSNVKYQCIKSMAELESNIDGSKSIKKLILK